MKQEVFESKLKPILLWMGTIVSAIMSIAYIIIVFVLVEGFKAKALLQTTVFSIITAVIGFCIMQMLKIQGQTFAKNIQSNKDTLDKYTRLVLNKSTEKEKKKMSIQSYWISSTIIDFLVKCGTLVITSVGMVYIMIEGSKDYSLLLLAVVNLLMFAGFGFISLVKTYDFYNDQYVPYMQDKIDEVNNEKQDKRLGMDKNQFTEQRDPVVHDNSRDNLLDTGMDSSASSTNCEPVVVDSSKCSNSILGGTIHTSNSTSDSTDYANQENNKKEM
jgi:hypothetical protein